MYLGTHVTLDNPINSQDSSPEARGARVQRIRRLANLDRKMMCNDPDIPINLNSLKGWEIGRYGGIPVAAAIRVCKRVAKEGVKVTPEWILHKIGTGPILIPHEAEIIEPIEFEKNLTVEDKNIAEELFLFKSHYPKNMDFIIKDNGMLPYFDIDDYVSGILLPKHSYKNAIGCNCIIQIKSGEIYVRNLRKGQTEANFNLACTNPEATVNEPIVYNAEILKLAPIIWHRKKISFFKFL